MTSGLIKQRIEMRLAQIGMSASALEQKAGLSSGAVRSILLGRSSNPTINTLTAIARVLDCSISDLAEEKQPSVPSLDKFTNKKEALPWKSDVFLNALNLVENDLKRRKYQPNLDEILFFTKEIYAYSLEDNNQTIDEKFARWLIDKNIKIY